LASQERKKENQFKKTRKKKRGKMPSGQMRVRPIDKLEEACTNTDDAMMLVQHRRGSGDCVMS